MRTIHVFKNKSAIPKVGDHSKTNSKNLDKYDFESSYVEVEFS